MCSFHEIARIRIDFPDKLWEIFRHHRINMISVLFGAFGMLILVLGIRVVQPAGAAGVLADSYQGWLGIMADAVLLYWINRSIRREEEQRLLEQFGSESNAFVRDAARQLRKKGWLTNGRLDGADFSHADLGGTNLSQAKLREVDLSHADLSDAMLVEADLQGSNLMGVDLRGAECRWGDFRNANLRWANLEGAALDGAQFEGADLSFAKLGDANFATVHLRGARMVEGLSREEIALVQSSVRLLRKSMEAFSAAFYRELFRLPPLVKTLFLTGIKDQSNKFAQFFELLIRSLNDPEKLLPALKALGKRHAKYRVVEQHYEMVGTALMNTLNKSLGAGFTPEVEETWWKMYRLVTMVMLDAAEEGDWEKG